MSWNYTPTQGAASGMLNDWKFVVQFPHAISERKRAAGQALVWAPQNWEYDTGIITAVTDHGATFDLTDNAKNWILGSGHKRWTEAVPGETGVPEWTATSFDVVVHCPDDLHEPDPRLVMQFGLSTQSNATTITCTGDLSQKVVERTISAASDLVGRRYWIIRRDGLNWTRAYPTGPNAPHYAYGLVKSVAAVPDSSHLRVTTRASLKQTVTAVGKDLIYFAGGKLQRATIAAATSRTLDYDPSTTTAPPDVDGVVYVVEANGLWRWGVWGGKIQAAYGGRLTTGYYSHNAPDFDSVGTALLPTLTYGVTYASDPLDCPADPETVVIRDTDYFIPQDNACGDGDIYLNPDIYKPQRGWWQALLEVCSSYVTPIDHTGDSAVSIPAFVPATWLSYAGINPVSGTTGTLSGGSMPCAISVPYTPIPLWWAIVDSDGSVMEYGYTDTYDGATLGGATVGFSSTMNGKAVVGSLGPSRIRPKRVGRFRDVKYWLPGLDEYGAVVAPSAAHPGTWVTRHKSTRYLASDKDGLVGDSNLSADTIVDGDYCRLVGDCFSAPGFAALISADVDEPRKDYYNNASVGTRHAATEGRIQASLSGQVDDAASSEVRIVDPTKDWLSVDFYAPTNGVTVDIAFTSGGTTTGTDSTLAGAPALAAARFDSGFGAPYEHYCLEVLISGTGLDDPQAVVAKRLLTSVDPATGAFAWAEALPESCNGKTGRIKEPLVLNRWAGLKAYVREQDRSTGVVSTRQYSILGNHDDTLFVSQDFVGTPGKRLSYRIGLEVMSGVYERVSGAWVTTADGGDDPRNPGTNPFVADARFNAEDLVVRYGLPLPTDVTYAFKAGWQELYDAINVLREIKGGTPTMHSDANRSCSASWHNETSSWATFANHVISGDGSGFPGYFDNSAIWTGASGPTASFSGSGLWNWTGSAWVVSAGWTGSVIRASARYDYTPPQDNFPKTVQFYSRGSQGGYEVFDDNNDAILLDQWKLFSSVGTTTATVTSAFLGKAPPAAPNQCAAPDVSELPSPRPGGPGASSVSHSRGYGTSPPTTLLVYAFKFVDDGFATLEEGEFAAMSESDFNQLRE